MSPAFFPSSGIILYLASVGSEVSPTRVLDGLGRLKDAYLQAPVLASFRKFLRFVSFG